MDTLVLTEKTTLLFDRLEAGERLNCQELNEVRAGIFSMTDWLRDNLYTSFEPEHKQAIKTQLAYVDRVVDALVRHHFANQAN